MRPHGQENWKMYSISPMLTLRRYLVIQIKQPKIFQFDKKEWTYLLQRLPTIILSPHGLKTQITKQSKFPTAECAR